MQCNHPFDLLNDLDPDLAEEALGIKDIPSLAFPSARDESSFAHFNEASVARGASLRFSVSERDIISAPWIAARWVAVASDSLLYRPSRTSKLRLYICCDHSIATDCTNTPCHERLEMLAPLFNLDDGCFGDNTPEVFLSRAMSAVAFLPPWYFARMLSNAVTRLRSLDIIKPHLVDTIRLRGMFWADIQYFCAELSIDLGMLPAICKDRQASYKIFGRNLDDMTDVFMSRMFFPAHSKDPQLDQFCDKIGMCKKWMREAWCIDDALPDTTPGLGSQVVGEACIALGLLASCSDVTLRSWPHDLESLPEGSRSLEERRSRICIVRASGLGAWHPAALQDLVMQLARTGVGYSATYLCSAVTVPIAHQALDLESIKRAYKVVEMMLSSLITGCMRHSSPDHTRVGEKGCRHRGADDCGEGLRMMQMIVEFTTNAARRMHRSEYLIENSRIRGLGAGQLVNLTIPMLPTLERYPSTISYLSGPKPSWVLSLLNAVTFDDDDNVNFDDEVDGGGRVEPNYSWLRIDHDVVYWCMLYLVLPTGAKGMPFADDFVRWCTLCDSAYQSLWMRDWPQAKRTSSEGVPDDATRIGFTDEQAASINNRSHMPSSFIAHSYSMLKMLDWFGTCLCKRHSLTSWMDMPFIPLFGMGLRNFFDFDGLAGHAPIYLTRLGITFEHLTKRPGLFKWPKVEDEVRDHVVWELWRCTHGQQVTLSFDQKPALWCDAHRYGLGTEHSAASVQQSCSHISAEAMESARLKAEADQRREQRKAERKAKKELARQEAQLTSDEAANQAATELMSSALRQVFYETQSEQESRAARKETERRRAMIEQGRAIREAREQRQKNVHHSHDHRAPDLFPELKPQPGPEEALHRLTWVEDNSERAAKRALNKQRKEAEDAKAKEKRNREKEKLARKSAPCGSGVARMYMAPSETYRSVKHLGDAIEAAEIAACKMAPPVVRAEELAIGEEVDPQVPVVRGA